MISRATIQSLKIVRSHRRNIQIRALSSTNKTTTNKTTTTTTSSNKLNYDIIPKDDFGPYKEYSVIFTNRSLNLMSDPFQKVMRDLNNLLKETYNCSKGKVAIIPG